MMERLKLKQSESQQQEVVLPNIDNDENEQRDVVESTKVIGMRWIDKHGNQWLIDSDGVPKSQNIEITANDHDEDQQSTQQVISNDDIPSSPPPPTTAPKAQSAFDRLGVDQTAYDLDTIFSTQCIGGEAHCVDRVRFVVRVYLKWIRFTKSLNGAMSDDDGIDIVDLIDNELPGKYSFIDFQVDFGRILKNNDLLKMESDTVLDAECTESDSFILRRHQRPKDWYSRNGDKMDSLFFTVNEDEARRSVVVQQCLDSVHHYLEHRETIDIEKVVESMDSVDAQSADKGEDDDIDIDSLLHDHLVDAVDRQINERRASGRYRGRNRGIETEKFNKFLITNSYHSTKNTLPQSEPISMDNESKEDIDSDIEPKQEPEPQQKQGAEEEIQCEDCFVEQLFNELLLHGLAVETVLKLRAFL